MKNIFYFGEQKANIAGKNSLFISFWSRLAHPAPVGFDCLLPRRNPMREAEVKRPTMPRASIHR